jgi:hypothetical protein
VSRTPRSPPIPHDMIETLIHPSSVMSLQNNPQPFSLQNGAIAHLTGGPSRSLPHLARTRPQLSVSPPDHPSNGVQDLLFTHPVPLPRQTFQNDQPWMSGRPRCAGPMLSMQERVLNPDIGTIPLYHPSWSNPTANHDNYYPAGVSLAINPVEHR